MATIIKALGHRTVFIVLGLSSLLPLASRAEPSDRDPCGLQRQFYLASAPDSPERRELETAFKKCQLAVELEKAPLAESGKAWAASLEKLNGGWLLLLVTQDGTTAFFGSRRHAVRDGSMLTLWTRTEFRDERTDGTDTYKSEVDRNIYDCHRAATKPVATTRYQNNNLSGKAVAYTFAPEKMSWEAVVPGTVGDAVMSWACASITG